MNDLGELAAPTIYNGVMYVINGKWTFAIGAPLVNALRRVSGSSTTGVRGMRAKVHTEPPVGT